MTSSKFTAWCAAAVSGIVFPPDRETVRRELLSHMYDHYDDLVDQGVDSDTAEMMALSAMGSAAEIAPQLAAIHRPFWGYFLRFTRGLLALTLCAVLLCTGIQIWRTDYYDPTDSVYNFDPYGQSPQDREYGTYERVFYAEPGQAVHADGYTITLTRAAVWRSNYTDPAGSTGDPGTLYFQMKIFNPRPWAEFSDISRWFWAVDSLGNRYECFYNGIHNYNAYISGNGYHTGPQTYTHYMWINDFPFQDAQWIEFHYDRDGRDLVIRLDLTGGAES